MITLGIPVLDAHELTRGCVQTIVNTVNRLTDFRLVIIDNGSSEPYRREEFPGAFPIEIIRYSENKGFYLPMLDIYNRYDGYVGLCHNDILFYDQDWNIAIEDAFKADPLLGLIGLCGSNQVDNLGGRGSGTMMNFKSIVGQPQAGIRIEGKVPAMILDSLFMLFRREVIPQLLIDENITPCHFYDKIWSCRVIENKWHVAVMGVGIDHIGGTTSTAKEYQNWAYKWCKDHNVPIAKGQSGDLALYLEGERRFLSEYRDQKRMIPGSVDSEYRFL